jgi:glutathione synthase
MKRTSRKILWITDPWNTLDHANDTTLRLIEESIRAGHKNFWCDVKSIRIERGEVKLTAFQVLNLGGSRRADEIELSQPKSFGPEKFSHICYRTDPPVDHAYLLPLQILDLKLRTLKKVKMVNSIYTLFSANEKMEGLALLKLFPSGVVSSEREHLLRFLQIEKKVILKPLYQAQSKGVKLLDSTRQSNTELEALLRQETQNFKTPIMLQKFLPGIHQGEQRLWYVRGQLIGVARKQPKSGEAIIDMDQGGSLVTTKLNAKEAKASKQIGAYLKKQKIDWAAVDLIDGFVTDFNFTSPGLIPLMEKVTGQNLAKKIVNVFK